MGADLAKDIPYQYLEYFLEDEEELMRIKAEYASGKMLTGEVKKILKDAYDKALAIIRENRAAMDEIAAFLLEKETISGKEFMNIFRKYRREEPEKLPETASSEIIFSEISSSKFLSK